MSSGLSGQHSETLTRVAKSSSTVLIQGETGTGKTTAAREIHRQSARAASPFVVFDCAAVAPTLIESALFGHERGAFTGAVEARAGALETAKEGTLFIDEVTELQLQLQPKLLRALEEREFSRVGSNQVVTFTARIIVASQFDLLGLVKEGRFRQDLYFRLAVARLNMPALREQRARIPDLVDALFADAFGSSKRFATLSPRLRNRILTHEWPGNLRELRNVVERIALIEGSDDNDETWSDHLVNTAHPSNDDGLGLPASDYELPFHEFKDRMLDTYERKYLQRLLARCDGSVSKAAQTGKMNRRYLYQLMTKYGLR